MMRSDDDEGRANCSAKSYQWLMHTLYDCMLIQSLKAEVGNPHAAHHIYVRCILLMDMNVVNV